MLLKGDGRASNYYTASGCNGTTTMKKIFSLYSKNISTQKHFLWAVFTSTRIER